MPTYLRWLNTLIILGVLVGGPWAYAHWRERETRSFRVVDEGVLYRSGRVSLSGLHRLVHDYGIRTIISLREAEADGEADEVKYCERWGLNHVRIPPLSWDASSGPAPVEKGLAVFRKVMSNPANHPVLIHCFAGKHRTGGYCAVYRMQFQGWSNDQALDELRRLGYDQLDNEQDIRGFLSSYEPRDDVVRPASRRR